MRKSICVLFITMLVLFVMGSCSPESNTNNISSQEINSNKSEAIQDNSDLYNSSHIYPQESPKPLSGMLDDGKPSTIASSNKDATGSNLSKNSDSQEMRAVWISYLDYYDLLKGHGYDDAKKNISVAFKNVKDMNLNTVIVQVRPFADAFYISSYFPWSHVLKGEQSLAPGYDPLQLMIDVAKENNLEIHAWINPYRIQIKGEKNTPEVLSDNNQAKKWLDAGNDNVIEIKSGIYFNPSSDEVIDFVTCGVKEIVENYDVDGIHFDDYFYPTTDENFDIKYFNEYEKNGGTLSHEDWRLENVNKLVKNVYSEIKAIDPDVVFGISPQGNIKMNYSSQYADVKTWVKNDGYVDYIMPQLYYGFNNSTAPYESTIKEWHQLINNTNTDLYIGLAAYKVGVEDTWAGDGVDEWTKNKDMLKRQIDIIHNLQEVKGFAFYRYDSLFKPSNTTKEHIKEEKNQLSKILEG